MLLFILGVLSALVAIFLFFKKKYLLTACLIFCATILIRFHYINQDPYLHDWDEKYHALVAKNMMQEPFAPKLRAEPVLDYDYTDWSNNYIWLHKQPLFLWQMVLSLKVFGINEFAVRFPSALLCGLIAIIIFRIGFLMKKLLAGLSGSLLFCFSFFSIEQTTGAIGMDHNDVAMLFYVTASIWSLMEYYDSRKWYWLIIIGIFTGCAVLVKWLTGLLVFFCWGLYILIADEKKFFIKNGSRLLISFVIACCIFLPWQFYINERFAFEAQFERAFARDHLTRVVEGHRGNYLTYINNLDENYSLFVIPLLLTGILILLKIDIRKQFKIIILSAVLFIYFFFSLIVTTKVVGYVFIIAPFIFLLAGLNFEWFYEFLAKRIKLFYRNITVATLVCVSCYFMLKYETLRKFHELGRSDYNWESREAKINNTNIYRSLDSYLNGKYIVFNVLPRHEVDAMFYSNQNVYRLFPDEDVFKNLKAAGYKIAAFTDHNEQLLPDYIKNDPEVVIIDMVLMK